MENNKDTPKHAKTAEEEWAGLGTEDVVNTLANERFVITDPQTGRISYSASTTSSNTYYIMDKPGYESLAEALFLAYEQASIGKGDERHANDKPFTEQPMQVVAGLLGSSEGLAFQAAKKLNEGLKLPTKDRRIREYLGAIVYIAGMVVYEQNKPDS